MNSWKGCLAAVIAGLGMSASAQVISTGGAMVHVAAPPDVRADVYESNTEIRIFDEAQGVTGPDLDVDVTNPGFVNSAGALSPATIPSGTTLWSYYIIFDPVGSTTKRATGSATFANEIVGIVVLTSSLASSNWLGAPGTLYPSTGLAGLELNPDSVTLSADRHTIDVDITASTPGDRVRVITSAPVPEPFTLGLAGAGLAAGWRRRRGRR